MSTSGRMLRRSAVKSASEFISLYCVGKCPQRRYSAHTNEDFVRASVSIFDQARLAIPTAVGTFWVGRIDIGCGELGTSAIWIARSAVLSGTRSSGDFEI